ncbi:hypothetical protein AAMO2058_000633500 [Amorphochlora amoebiformis]
MGDFGVPMVALALRGSYLLGHLAKIKSGVRHHSLLWPRHKWSRSCTENRALLVPSGKIMKFPKLSQLSSLGVLSALILMFVRPVREYGDRTTNLILSLTKAVQHVGLFNTLITEDEVNRTIPGFQITDSFPPPLSVFEIPKSPKMSENLPDTENSGIAGESRGYRPPPTEGGVDGLLRWYWLDKASLLPALTLAPKDGHTVLDMCAAPGGKSLVLAMQLFANITTTEEREMGDIRLTCNEKSSQRRANLQRVIFKYLPENVRDHVYVTNRDASRWIQGNTYDRVLVDVPCSSERHLVSESWRRREAIDKATWSPARCKRYASSQYALLKSAFTVTKPGGLIAYSTCSLSSVENEKVAQRLLKKFGDCIKVIDDCGELSEADLLSMGAEKRNPGWILLPDRAGCGPIYWVTLMKTRCPPDSPLSD